MSSVSLFTHKLLEGDTYTSARGLTLDDTNTASVHIENPAGSGKVIVLDTITVRVGAGSDGVFYRSPDISGGNSSGTANDLVGSSKSSVVNITYDATFSNPSSTTKFPLSNASGPTTSGLAERPQIALQQGESIGVEVTSETNGNDILFLFTMYETERGLDG